MCNSKDVVSLNIKIKQIEIMKNSNELPTVQGEINKAQGGHYLLWDCPILNIERDCQGEFFFNKETEEFEHIVSDEEGVDLYKVTAKL